jgi:hypothetical protein
VFVGIKDFIDVFQSWFFFALAQVVLQEQSNGIKRNKWVDKGDIRYLSSKEYELREGRNSGRGMGPSRYTAADSSFTDVTLAQFVVVLFGVAMKLRMVVLL